MDNKDLYHFTFYEVNCIIIVTFSTRTIVLKIIIYYSFRVAFPSLILKTTDFSVTAAKSVAGFSGHLLSVGLLLEHGRNSPERNSHFPPRPPQTRFYVTGAAASSCAGALWRAAIFKFHPNRKRRATAAFITSDGRSHRRIIFLL